MLPLLLHGQVLFLPKRATDAPSGTEIVRKVAALNLQEREQEIISQILAGNIPEFLRKLCPIQVSETAGTTTNVALYYVAPDYLAVGSDADYFLTPLSPDSAQRIADALHCTLPTRKMVNDIYRSAAVKLVPEPIPPSSAMTSIQVFSDHNARVHSQRAQALDAAPLGSLVAGHKKDVVISARLAQAPGKVAIYGWHQTNGIPIQPLYLGHSAAWVDYSQCIRLVQDRMLLNGTTRSIAEVLAEPATSSLLSDEGPLASPRYPPARDHPSSASTQWSINPAWTGERTAVLYLDPEVKITVNCPTLDRFDAGKKRLLIYYALPNGNSTEQTIGKKQIPDDDWHYGIQHIGAQTRWLRELLTNQVIVVAYLENSLQSWPAWRKKYGDKPIPKLFAAVKALFHEQQIETVLTGHSGGGSLIFGYLNTMKQIPDDTVRIAFLDSNYAYDPSQGHSEKLVAWLKAGPENCLCVFCYNDAIALLNGKSFVSPERGTWGRSHAMQRDLAETFSFERHVDEQFERYFALSGRVQFLMKENPERKILHTLQVERNGFIHALLAGTGYEDRGYEYFGEPVYNQFIQE